MRNIILYRRCNSLKEDDKEIETLQAAGFVYLSKRSEIQKGDFVVPRYSALPYFNELAEDCKEIGATLINSLSQHNYVADLQNYVVDLKELTPQTYDNLENLPDNTSFILKGETNSLKGRWNSHMFAEDKSKASEIYGKLLADSLISQQKIYIREYIPLYTYLISIGGCPVTKEFRFFVYNQKILSGGFYWSSHVDDISSIPSIEEVPKEFLDEIIKRIGNNVSAYVIDVAQTKEGKWIVIELNDLTQSGLSENNPYILYSNLFSAINASKLEKTMENEESTWKKLGNQALNALKALGYRTGRVGSVLKDKALETGSTLKEKAQSTAAQAVEASQNVVQAVSEKVSSTVESVSSTVSSTVEEVVEPKDECQSMEEEWKSVGDDTKKLVKKVVKVSNKQIMCNLKSLKDNIF